MQIIRLVTGNKDKLAEWRRLLPVQYGLESVAIDLPEIQSLDLEEIIFDKARRAYEITGKPIVVEDIAAGLDELKGLPGPFIKFFEQQLGTDALFQLAGGVGELATVRCAIAYYDGKESTVVFSEVKGSVMPARGTAGFGFDCCFVPAGQTKTYAEMSPDEKDAISHRAKAVKAILAKLQS